MGLLEEVVVGLSGVSRHPNTYAHRGHDHAKCEKLPARMYPHSCAEVNGADENAAKREKEPEGKEAEDGVRNANPDV